MRRAAFLVVLVVIIILSALLGWCSLTNGHNWGDDFAGFVMQAVDLATGRMGNATRMTRYAIEHSTRTVGPATGTWGTPILLAPLITAFGFNFLALKSLNLAAFLLFLILLGTGLFSNLSSFVRLSIVSLFAFNPSVMKMMDNIGCDLPFLFFSTLGMVLMERIVIRNRTLLSPPVDRVVLGLAIACAYFIRANGALIMITLTIVQATELFTRRTADSSRKQLPGFVHALPYVSFALAATIWTVLLPDENAKLGATLTFSTSRMVANLQYYSLLIADFFEGVPGGKTVYLASLPLLAGGIVRLRRTGYHTLVYSALTALLFVILPFQQGLRYFLPILPFYALFVLAGLEWPLSLLKSHRRAVGRVLLAASVLVTVGFMAQVSFKRAVINLRMNRSLFYGVATHSAAGTFQYILEKTRKSDVIVFFKPRAMMLLTGRRSITVHEPSALGRGDYLCVYQGPTEGRQIPQEAIFQGIADGSLMQVHVEKTLVLYRINRAP